MFGSKFRTWMEAHIVRPRKKNQRQDKENGTVPAGKTIHSGPTTLPNSPVETNTIKYQNNSIHNSDSGSQLGVMLGTTGKTHPAPTSSNGTPNGVNGSAGGTSLSSPESAYSTGYSTDGTSPGASFPPEYYINIRTGTHYFQQAPLRPIEKNKPPPPPPPPRNLPPKQVDFSIQSKSPSVVKKELQKKTFPLSHRRSESCDVGRCPAIFRAPPPPPPPPPPIEETMLLLNPSSILASASPSPRQRSRIRTNPWVATNSPVGTTSSTSSQKYAEESTGSCSSGGFKKHTKATIEKSSSGSSSSQPSRRFCEDSASSGTACSLMNGNKLKVCHNSKISVLAACRERSPSVRSPNPSVTWSPRRLVMNISESSSSGSRRSSEDDLTLHEMMGKYDESYVYERETDILSDSDPTDCEECGDTDVDTGQDGGDEQDPEDLDFIDKDSYLDLNLSDTERGPRRIGHSTYYHFPNELSRRLSRHRENSRRSNNNSRKSNSKSRVPRRRRPRDNNGAGSRSLGGTPVSHRRKHSNHVSDIRSNHQSPSKLSMQKTVFIENSHIDSSKRRSNSVSYVSRRCEVQTTSNGKFMANFDSEIALIEADKEADKKYKELILEAEHILVSMKANTPLLGSPRRIMNNPPTNKRVEILRNTESDLLPKLRNGDSVPGSPKPCNSPRFSPKKNHITNFIQMNSPELSRREQKLCVNENVYNSPKKVMTYSPVVQRSVIQRGSELRQSLDRCPNSPRMIRTPIAPASPVRKYNTLGNSSIPGSPNLQVNSHCGMNGYSPISHKSSQTNSPTLHIDDDSDESTEKESSIREVKPNNGSPYISEALRKDILKRITGKNDSHSGDSGSLIGGTSSSSDGDIIEPKRNLKQDKRPPLMTFRSVDMGHQVPDSNYCPQSEPVKRKVYSCSNTFDRLQKSLDKYHLIRQKSDGESPAVDDSDLLTLLRNSDECRNGLREKVARLRNERIEMEERIKQQNNILQQQQGQFQRLFKQQMLLQTIEGLKRSLEDQSASLKQTYQSPDIKSKNIESF